MMEKEKIINAFNNAWNKKIASENSYGKLASKEMFENKEEIIIDESNATEFNYTLKSIDKVVGCKFVKENYTPKEICELLKQFCMVLDLKILEAKGE